MGKSDKKDRSRSKDRNKDKKDKHSKKKHKKDSKRKRSYSSSSQSSSESRSRSRSRTPEKTKKSRADSRSRSSSYSRSRSSSPDRRKEHKKRFSDVPKNIQKPRDRLDEKGKKRLSVNNFALAGFILESKKTNERLDREEVARANEKFKKLDHSERKAMLLSGALNNKEEWSAKDEYSMEYRNGEYVKVHKPYSCGIEGCGMRFAFSYELNDHMAQHNKQETELNQKRAQQFAQKFGL